MASSCINPTSASASIPQISHDGCGSLFEALECSVTFYGIKSNHITNFVKRQFSVVHPFLNGAFADVVAMGDFALLHKFLFIRHWALIIFVGHKIRLSCQESHNSDLLF